MEKIATQIDVVAAPQKVIEAITTTAGHRGWWTTDCEVGRRPGEQATFRFNKDAGRMSATFRIDRSDERGLEWTCVAHENNPDWQDTRLAIRVTPAAAGSHVELEHSGWRERSQVYDMCVGGWQHFMQSLKQYLETGVGTPFGK